MNPLAILALLGDLYEQAAALRQENDALRAELEKRPPAPEGQT